LTFHYRNVLISVKKNGSLRMMLSDFGLAKRLDHGQSSYVQTGKNAIGSVGWRAPECLRGEVQLDDLEEGSSPMHSTEEDMIALLAGRRKAGSRLTKAVDLFALGCLYFYALTAGQHPYGDRYEREVNIIRNEKVGMDRLDALGEDGHEAAEIIQRLLSPRAEDR
jgi:serine/threonine-protein kinase/endoribonuclease IRE1